MRWRERARGLNTVAHQVASNIDGSRAFPSVVEGCNAC